jgi:hypothetical protein
VWRVEAPSVRYVLQVTKERGFKTVNERVSGTVKWFNNAKGYGFIQPDEGSRLEEDKWCTEEGDNWTVPW